MLVLIASALLLTLSLSADCFATGFAYGANKIKIPFQSAMVINLTCTCVLALSLFCGKAIGHYIPASVTLAICASILITLGLAKIFGKFIKRILQKSRHSFIKILTKPEEADFDKSKVLSKKEAVVLALALSLDGLAVGVGTGLVLNWIGYLIIIGFSLVTDIALLISGALVGRKVATRTKLDLSWASGVILIAIAFIKLFV
ncbi:MAG: manganese efflux pump [Christensenellaceae bacterium]|jgi:putative sporulation protein YtaF|nr:manganese efflux pump [Christensenellaceae bacterium]